MIAASRNQTGVARCALAALLALACCPAGAGEPAAGQRWSLALRLYADTKAKHVGDILTVIIDENAQSAKDAKGSTSKNTAIGGSISMAHPTVDARPTAWTNAAVPAWNVNGTRTFQGAGSTENKDKFVTRMSVTVREVLPNGNLLVEGSRAVVIRGDTVNLHLTGTVRPQDVTRENTLSSSQIADAIIRYDSSGMVATAQDRGMVSKLLDWINPF